MNVAINLGVDDVDAPIMRQARQQWSDWGLAEPALAPIVDLLDLRSWTRSADQVEVDQALRALAKLGSKTGEDDVAAVAALTWALVPGATRLSSRLAALAPDVDELVAVQLWIACRTFDWRNRRYVAPSLLRDTMRGVQAELGFGELAKYRDKVWANSKCFDPDSPVWHIRSVSETEHTNDEVGTELGDLLMIATDADVISVQDRELLVDLAVASDQVGGLSRRGRGGLMAPAACELIADRWGISQRTIRRRAARAIDSLTVYSTQLRDADDPASHVLPLSA